MKYKLLFISLFGTSLFASSAVFAADDVAPSSATVAQTDQAGVLRFSVDRYIVEGATLLTQAELDAAVAPYVGKGKDFSDVQRALEAIENAYVARGFSAVRVLLPEQELEQGTVRFSVVESHFGVIKVIDNHFVTEENALNAVPSVRSGGVPRSKDIARELKLANENPARQMNVVLKASEKEDEVDANVVVTDTKPTTWGVTSDNSGSPETGRTRLGVSYRHANLFGRDHIGSLQYQMSPERPNRLTVLGGSYKIPLYQSGDSLEFFGGYSNVNSVVGGLGNLKGGGLLFNARYNHPLEKVGIFDPRISFGLDWRDFRRIELNTAPATVLFNEIVVVPLSVAYTAQGKLAKSDVGFNVSFSANLPGSGKGGSAAFAAYDTNPNNIKPGASYKVVRYGANYSQLLGNDWQVRAAMNGQWSPDVLIQGEQLRLGGADGVRGFSEGSEGGEIGLRWNLEGYSPDFGKGDLKMRALAFFDAGEVRPANGARSSISSAGFGLRAGYGEQFTMRFDAGRIINAGVDTQQRVGDWRAHIGLSASF